jgi:hypothetical protein
MITLSDGSTYLHRTTSPTPIYRSTKDTKNNPLWNPSSQKLANVEEDEAGRLKRFRGRFGRGWDAEIVTTAEEVSRYVLGMWKVVARGFFCWQMDVQIESGEASPASEQGGDSLMDLISGFGQEGEAKAETASATESKPKKGRGKKWNVNTQGGRE